MNDSRAKKVIAVLIAFAFIMGFAKGIVVIGIIGLAAYAVVRMEKVTTVDIW